MKTKLNLTDLKVESFITKQKAVNGGFQNVKSMITVCGYTCLEDCSYSG